MAAPPARCRRCDALRTSREGSPLSVEAGSDRYRPAGGGPIAFAPRAQPAAGCRIGRCQAHRDGQQEGHEPRRSRRSARRPLSPSGHAASTTRRAVADLVDDEGDDHKPHGNTRIGIRSSGCWLMASLRRRAWFGRWLPSGRLGRWRRSRLDRARRWRLGGRRLGRRCAGRRRRTVGRQVLRRQATLAELVVRLLLRLVPDRDATRGHREEDEPGQPGQRPRSLVTGLGARRWRRLGCRARCARWRRGRCRQWARRRRW